METSENTWVEYWHYLLISRIWRRQWHSTPVLLPGKSRGRRSLVGCSPWGRQSRTRLSDFTFTFHFHALEKEMVTHSSVLAWRIPGTGSLVGCRLWGRTESDTTKATQQQQDMENQNFLKLGSQLTYFFLGMEDNVQHSVKGQNCTYQTDDIDFQGP